MKKRWLYNEYLNVILALLLILIISIVGNFVGQVMSFMISGEFFVDATPYISTLISDIFCLAVIFFFRRNTAISFATVKLKESIGLFFTIFIGIALYSSGVFSLSDALNLQDSEWAGVNEVGLWLKIVTLCVIGPVYEEIFFRGVIFGILRKRTCFYVSAIISSAIFALGHGLGASAINAFGLGMFLCLACEKSNSLLVGTAIHITNNCLAVIPMTTSETGATDGGIGMLLSIMIPLAISVIIFVATYKEDAKRIRN